MKPVQVSDHAVLRYLERAHGLDVEVIRKHLSGLAVNAARLGASAVTIENVKLVLRASHSEEDTTAVVTVIRPAWPGRHKGTA